MHVKSRRGFIKVMLGALAAFTGIGTLATQAAAAPRARPKGIRKLKGDVRVNGTPARVGMSVEQGDVITTGKGSHAVFVIAGDAFLLKADAEVQVAKPASGLREMFLKKGGMLSVFERGARARVTTTTAVAGIRGTGMYVEIEPNCTYICLCYGEADLEAVAFKGVTESVKTRHHEAPRFIYGPGAPEAITPAGMKNHTDDELVMLESMVGRKPAFVEIGAEGFEKY